MSLPEVMSCGFIVFRWQPQLSFLLMEHADRWDLPKGHVDEGENEMQCALRELEEETGIRHEALQVDPDFRFETQYEVRYRRKFDGATALKTLVIFLAFVNGPQELQVTEHQGYRWVDWRPPHRIQTLTIDPLLAAVEKHFAGPNSPII
ncbi:MAG: NUDIX domain-containing protein [Planctomycetales bacterium]|nr:NUDIX domain-containing protein [Planctomycetales bacterium]